MRLVSGNSGTLSSGILIGMLGGPDFAGAQSQNHGIYDVFSFGFDRCLEILRTQDPGAALRANRERRPSSVCIGAPLADTAVTITICDDARLNADALTIQSCTVRAMGETNVSDRLDLARWADEMQTTPSDLDGIAELPSRRDRTVPRYGWCEDDDQPFIAEFGSGLPGQPIHVAIYNFAASDDPNPCAED